MLRKHQVADSQRSSAGLISKKGDPRILKIAQDFKESDLRTLKIAQHFSAGKVT